MIRKLVNRYFDETTVYTEMFGNSSVSLNDIIFP